jgi:hypothetical protein
MTEPIFEPEPAVLSSAQPPIVTIPETACPGVRESIKTDGGEVVLTVTEAVAESGFPSESIAVTVMVC